MCSSDLHLVLFFFLVFTRFEEYGYCLLNSSRKCWLFNHEQFIYARFMDSQIPLFNNFFIKNWSYGTIHTFKNYFATVFFSFQFQQNKFYPNKPLGESSNISKSLTTYDSKGDCSNKFKTQPTSQKEYWVLTTTNW